jgi:hypothetical protein
MNATVEVLTVLVLSFAALTAFAVYRWRQRQRVCRIKGWINEFLVARFSVLPKNLTVSCSNDLFWPIMVDFDDPRSGAPQRLQFVCGKARSTFALRTE